MAAKHKPIPYPQDAQSARQYFYDHGICIRRWAVAMGFRPQNVKDVLHKRNKASRGAGHEIAVALGIKRKPLE